MVCMARERARYEVGRSLSVGLVNGQKKAHLGVAGPK